jgi:hypothetical protein
MIGDWNAGCLMDSAAFRACRPALGMEAVPPFRLAAELWLTGRCLKLLRLATTGGRALTGTQSSEQRKAKHGKRFSRCSRFPRPRGTPFDAARSNQGIPDTLSAS